MRHIIGTLTVEQFRLMVSLVCILLMNQIRATNDLCNHGDAMVNEQDVFILGSIHCLKSIMKSIKDTNGTANDIDWEEVLDQQRRNLSDPSLEEMIVSAEDLEGWK